MRIETEMINKRDRINVGFVMHVMQVMLVHALSARDCVCVHVSVLVSFGDSLGLRANTIWNGETFPIDSRGVIL